MDRNENKKETKKQRWQVRDAIKPQGFGFGAMLFGLSHPFQYSSFLSTAGSSLKQPHPAPSL